MNVNAPETQLGKIQHHLKSSNAPEIHSAHVEHQSTASLTRHAGVTDRLSAALVGVGRSSDSFNPQQGALLSCAVNCSITLFGERDIRTKILEIFNAPD